MVRTAVATAIALVAFNGVHGFMNLKQSSAMPVELKVGDYYRPSGNQVSGIVDNNAQYHRSPCPGLNTLANHGHLSRNGKNIEKASLAAVFKNVYNVAEEWTQAQLNRLPDVFNLDFISRSDRDASFARDDRYFGRDPAEVNVTLAQNFLDRADADGKITLATVAHARMDFAAMCKASNPECNFNVTVETTAFRQAALLLTVFGKTDYISAAHAESFMVEERIPGDFVKSEVPVTIAALNTTFHKLVEVANVTALM